MIRRPTGATRTVPLFQPRANGLDSGILREAIDTGNNMLWPHVQQALVGKPAVLQGAILAHVVSLWLSAYAVNGFSIVEPMLVNHISLVRQLLTLNSQVIGQMLNHGTAE